MRAQTRRSRSSTLLITALCALAVGAACDRAAPDAVQSTELARLSPSAKLGSDALATEGVASFARPSNVPSAVPAVMPDAQPRAGDQVTSMLIRRGDVYVRVDSIEPAMAALRALAQRLGGTVGNTSIAAGDYNVRTATLELRIPSARFDEALGGITPIGKVESSNVSAQDVAEEYVDIKARITNGRRLESRLIDLLATRTGKLEDVLAVERELARVREEIERHEGRVRWLGARVETSTISVTVSERAPVVGQNPGQSVIGQAFVQAWRNFVGLVARFIASLGVLLPIGLALFVAARWWQRRRAARSVEA